jgi:hypothetical protein
MGQQILSKCIYLPKHVISLPRRTVILIFIAIRTSVLLKPNFNYLDNVLGTFLHQIDMYSGVYGMNYADQRENADSPIMRSFYFLVVRTYNKQNRSHIR